MADPNKPTAQKSTTAAPKSSEDANTPTVGKVNLSPATPAVITGLVVRDSAPEEAPPSNAVHEFHVRMNGLAKQIADCTAQIQNVNAQINAEDRLAASLEQRIAALEAKVPFTP